MPFSIIFPSFITRITSASRIVESLWATIKLVLPSIILLNAFCILISVLVSMEEVASSSISIGGIRSITLVIHKSCFCPWERLPPSSVITVSYPCGSLFIKLWECAFFAASIISSSVASGLPYAMFSFIVPDFSHVS